MKWDTWEGCQISEDRRVLKAANVDQLPEKLKCVFLHGFNNPEYEAKIIQRALYEDPYKTSDNYNYKNEYIGITFKNGNNTTIVNEKLLKKFKQKSSKFFLGQNNCPIIIQNKNYIVMLAPCVDMGNVIEYLPLN